MWHQRYKPWTQTVASGPREILGLPAALVAGFTLLALGTLLRVTCYRTLGRFFTFELTLKEKHALVTCGPYAVVRHPAYSGSLLALAGCVLTHMGPGSWWAETRMWAAPAGAVAGIAFLCNGLYMLLFLIARTIKEDAVLRAEFKEQWEAWAERSPYRIVPYIY